MQSTQPTTAVEQVYAQALLALAEEAGELESVTEQLQDLADLLKTQPDLGRLLGSRVLSATERAGIIDRAFKGNVSDLVLRFLQTVNAKDRLGALPGMIRAFSVLVDEKHGVVEVDAWVAHRLTPTQVDEVAARIGQALGRRVVLHQYVDPDLIGGLKLRVADQLIDGTVQTQLKRLRRRLLAIGRDTARNTNLIVES